jgi:pimeloyl-ACP methyl ester carboxylesterase
MGRAPILMVHGAFCGGWVYDDFAVPFIEAGHRVVAPDLPGHGAQAGRTAVAGLSMSDYAAAIASAAAKLETPPVLLGHSLGGLVAMLAAMRVRTQGLILLAPSPPWGVSGATMEEAISAVALYALGPYWAQSITPDYGALRRFGVDRLPRPERRAIYQRMGPESGRALFETLNWWLDPFMSTMVYPEKIKAPMLALVGERDVIHPAGTVRETAKRLGAELRVLPQMSHWLPGEPGWRDIADLALAWLSVQAARSAA